MEAVGGNSGTAWEDVSLSEGWVQYWWILGGYNFDTTWQRYIGKVKDWARASESSK